MAEFLLLRRDAPIDQQLEYWATQLLQQPVNQDGQVWICERAMLDIVKVLLDSAQKLRDGQ